MACAVLGEVSAEVVVQVSMRQTQVARAIQVPTFFEQEPGLEAVAHTPHTLGKGSNVGRAFSRNR